MTAIARPRIARVYVWKRPSVLPGFGLTLGYSLVYLSIIV